MKDKKKDNAEAAENQPPADTETLEEESARTVESSEAGEAAQVPTEEPAAEPTLEEKIAELNDKLLRLAAEFDNYRKRMARQMDNIVSSANDQLLIEFMEIVDNFERALAHENNGHDAEAFRQGVEMILGQMTGLLARYNVTPIEALGQPFNPNLHEAMLRVDSEDYDEGIVAIEISRGYKLGDRVLRHSRVGVSTGAKKESDEDTDE